MVGDLKKLYAQKSCPPLIFFFQEELTDGIEFFKSLWPESRAISDTKQYFYKSFGIRKASVMEMMGPKSIVCALRATSKGHHVSTKIGDIWMMPGAFAVQENKILWHHKFKSVGDHPEWAKEIANIS